MQTFEVRELGRITRFHQRIERGANERAGPAAKHGLFAEQVGFRFITKRSFNYASSGTTDRLGPSQRSPFGPATSVPVNSNQSRYSATADEFASHHRSESFRCDHHNIDIFSRNDCSITNRKAVSKEKRLPRSQIRSDFLLIDCGHLCVWQREKNDVTPPYRISRLENFETISFRTNARFASTIETDYDLHPAIAQVLPDSALSRDLRQLPQPGSQDPR